ncbi:uncharacterized protein [Primulina eburnea]|uniref:uncharacterized protein n=1 Tax=Primulina eburnea TaxID=1245227 RepID=UPI003C6C30B0
MQLEIVPKAVDLGFKVLIPSGDQMFTPRIVKNLELRLQNNDVQENLIELPMPEFDIILGMDWLSSKQRSISIRPPSRKSFIFETAKNKQMSHIIYCICARKLMKRGCQAFMASIVSVFELFSMRLEDVEIVRDFPSVFLEDVSGITSDREVDFSIG